MDIIKSPDTQKKERVPPGQKRTDKWPVLHHGNIPDLDISEWSFTISGLVEEELRIDYQEFIDLPRVKVLSDIHCVTGWSLLDNYWEGISTGVIRELVRIREDAKYVMIHGEGGFTTNLSLNDFFEPDVLFALSHNGSTLSRAHGYPVRLIVPRLYLWKRAKWVVGVEFMEEDSIGFWESRGYHIHGDPWKEERYSNGRT